MHGLFASASLSSLLDDLAISPAFISLLVWVPFTAEPEARTWLHREHT